jgi:F420H(2)-dependent quinone reductase
MAPQRASEPQRIRADRGVTEQRVAREARGQELERYWPLLVKKWPAYERFFADTHERAIFVLQRQ